MLLQPVPQRLAGADAELLGHRLQIGRLVRVVVAHLGDHAHRTTAELERDRGEAPGRHRAAGSGRGALGVRGRRCRPQGVALAASYGRPLVERGTLGGLQRRRVDSPHTVWPTGTLDTWPFRRKDDHITGPGVFDMKAGLVQAVWALRALDELGLPRPACTLVLNGDEETGSHASHEAVVEAAAGSRLAMVFEAAADGSIKTARKGVGLFTLTVTGTEAHAGLDPTAGASAVDELAQQILHANRLRDHEAGTSVNVGVIEGGTRSNVTAGRARAHLDIRVASDAERQRITRALAGQRPADTRTRLEVTGDWNRPVFERSAQVAEFADLASACAELLGFGLSEASVGGASDGNFLAAAGIPVLDGIGAVGSGAHARSENTSVSGMVERAALAATVLVALAGR